MRWHDAARICSVRSCMRSAWPPCNQSFSVINSPALLTLACTQKHTHTWVYALYRLCRELQHIKSDTRKHSAISSRRHHTHRPVKHTHVCTLLTNANTSTCSVQDVLNAMPPLAASTLSNGLSQSLCAIYKHISMWPVTWQREREKMRSWGKMRTDEGGSVREGKRRRVGGGSVMEKDKGKRGTSRHLGGRWTE